MRSLIIGIAGGTGSGKTSVTKKIVESLKTDTVLVIAHDSYYRDLTSFDDPSPLAINFDHPSSLETSLLIEHLKTLRQGKSVHQPVYDFKSYRRLKQTRILQPVPIIIVEGILLFVEPELRELMDIRIFIDTDADERIIRRIRRDIVERGRSIDSVIDQYLDTAKPMHMEFVEPSKRWADIIVPRGVENLVAIEVVASRIKSMLLEKEVPGR